MRAFELYLLGELEEQEAAALRAEAKRDETVLRELELARAVVEGLDHRLEPPASLAAFESRVLAAAASQSVRQLDRRPLWITGVAAAALAFAIAWLAQPQPELSPRWSLVAQGDASFSVLAPNHVELERGEVLVAAVEPGRELVVTTPSARARLKSGQARIGVHKRKKGNEMKDATRLLILSGAAVLTNASGQVEGAERTLLLADEDTTPRALTVEASTGFAFDLLRAQCEASQGNVALSPYSVAVALAMLSEGARGETAREIGDVLHFPEEFRRQGADAQEIPWRTSMVHSGLSEISAAFQRGVRRNQLHVANAIWCEAGLPVNQTFQTRMQGAHGARFAEVQFVEAPDAARAEINRWVENQTQRHVRNLLPENSVTSLTRLVLTNAVYFKGTWQNPFDRARTRTRDFTLPSGEVVKVPMMRHAGDEAQGDGDEQGKTWPFDYYEEDGVQILSADYVGGELSMVFVLPSEELGANGLARKLSQTNWERWLRGLENQKVTVSMPRFRLQNSLRLKDTLAALGMPLVFSSEADLSGMIESEHAQLYASDVHHQVFLDVDEVGTEAAGATAIPTTRKGLADSSLSFVADRPFFAFVRESTTGVILFGARVTDPRLDER